MSLFYDWVTNIILFMLIGTVIEMLLPSNQLKKYVHFIFGLLFLLLLAQPIFYLFQTDITKQISIIENELVADDQQLQKTKYTIEKQKEDIQAEQTAYIWNELANQYIEDANNVLPEEYDVQVTEIIFDHGDHAGDDVITFTTIVVTLTEVEDQEVTSITTIKPIDLSKEQNESNNLKNRKRERMEQSLRKAWNLEENIEIEMKWEGG